MHEEDVLIKIIGLVIANSEEQKAKGDLYIDLDSLAS